jgi:integrase
LTGQRIASEVCRMQWRHIEEVPGGAWWRLPGTPEEGWPGRKSGGSHRVWLTPLALSIVKELGFLKDPVFDEPKRLDLVMKAACTAAGITERLTVHDLRRTHATLVARFFGRSAVSRILGHSDGSIAAVYDRHSYDSENKIIWEKVSEHIKLMSSEFKFDTPRAVA